MPLPLTTTLSVTRACGHADSLPYYSPDPLVANDLEDLLSKQPCAACRRQALQARMERGE